MKPLGQLCSPIVRRYFNAKGARIAPTAQIALGSRLSSGTVVGDNTWVNGPAVCRGGGRVTIGPHCAIGRELLVTTTNHDTRYPNMMLQLHWRHRFVDLHGPGDVTVGPASWIADRVTLLAGATLGVGTVVAAGAVVAKGEYPDYAILAGVPARVVRLRAQPEVAAALVESRWWTWPSERIQRNREFFESDLTEIDAATLRARARL